VAPAAVWEELVHSSSTDLLLVIGATDHCLHLNSSLQPTSADQPTPTGQTMYCQNGFLVQLKAVRSADSVQLRSRFQRFSQTLNSLELVVLKSSQIAHQHFVHSTLRQPVAGYQRLLRMFFRSSQMPPMLSPTWTQPHSLGFEIDFLTLLMVVKELLVTHHPSDQNPMAPQ